MMKAPRAIELAEKIGEFEIIMFISIRLVGSVRGSRRERCDRQTLDLTDRFSFMEAFGIDHAIVHPSQQMASDLASVSARMMTP